MTAPERIWVADHTHPDGTQEYVRADLAAVPAQVRVKPMDLSNAMKHAFIAGRVSAGAASSFHADAWAEYDPTESAGYARTLAAIEPHPDPTCCLGLTATDCADVASRHCAGSQPDPRDEVIARLVEALEWYADEETYETQYERMPCDCCTDIFEPINDDKGSKARAALAAAKAVQHG